MKKHNLLCLAVVGYAIAALFCALSGLKNNLVGFVPSVLLGVNADSFKVICAEWLADVIGNALEAESSVSVIFAIG